MRASLFLTLAISIGGAFVTPSAFAQEPQPGQQGQDGQDGQQGRRRGYDPGGWTNQAVDFLTEELQLDSDQQAKIRAILDESVRLSMQRFAQSMRNWDFGSEMDEGARDEARKAFEDVRVEAAKKINEVLTPAQRREFEVLVEQFDRRAQGFEQSRRAWQDPAELFNPRPQSKRLLLAKAERSLFLGPDETAVIMPFVERVLDAQQNLYEGRRVRRHDLQNAVSGGASKDEVTQRLTELRTAEQFQQLELAAASHALRELLTVEQEARFVAMGILD